MIKGEGGVETHAHILPRPLQTLNNTLYNLIDPPQRLQLRNQCFIPFPQSTLLGVTIRAWCCGGVCAIQRRLWDWLRYLLRRGLGYRDCCGLGCRIRAFTLGGRTAVVEGI